MSRDAVTSGLDNLRSVEDKLKGRRVGLMSNPSAVDKGLRSAAEVVSGLYGVTALYACEHGLLGVQQAGDAVHGGAVDPRTGARVYAAYGGDNHIEAGGLDGIDVFVYDMQQIGARFYTRLYALAYAMMDCARLGIPVVVLDRVNPVGGVKVEGTILDDRFRSFVGDFALPTRFGLTVGEYAAYVRDYCGLDLDLTVVPLRGWRRASYFDQTDLSWVPTSPNIPSLSSALCYLGTCVFEGTNVSEGRGTTLPFELVGAPWIDSRTLAEAMRDQRLPGMGFREASFVPQFSKHAGQQCNGLQLHVLDREAADLVAAGLLLCETIRDLWPDEFQWLPAHQGQGTAADRLLGGDDLTTGRLSARELLQAQAPGIRAFADSKRRYHLYD